MSRASPLLHIVDNELGNALILDLYLGGQRRFIIFDGGATPTDPLERNLGVSGHALFPRFLASAARAAWSSAAIGNTTGFPFKPTAVISLQSHDPYEGLLALLEVYKVSGITDPQSLFGGPFILPNPVNIQDGWKIPPTMRGRYTTIGEILKTWNYEATDKIDLSEALQGVQFLLPKLDKMVCYRPVTDVHTESPGDNEVLEPVPNSQGVLLKTTPASGGTALLATSTSDHRLSMNCFEGEIPHFSIYQIKSTDSAIFNNRSDIHVEIAKEFALWALMELGYHKLDFTDEQREILPPLNENDQLHSALSWALSRFYISEGGSGVASWSVEETGGGKGWLHRVEISEGKEWKVLQALPYLASVLKDAIGKFTLNGEAVAGLSAFCCLTVLRERKKEYLAKYQTALSEKLALLVDAFLDPSLRLLWPVSGLLEQMGRNLGELCLEKDKKLVNISSDPIRLGLFGFQETREGSYITYPEMWLHWMDPKEGGRVLDWSEYYSDIMETANSTKFYSRFSANSYFISPEGSENSQHRIKHTEIFGLAMSMSASIPPRKASLFLPGTKGLDWSALHQLAKAFGTTVPSLFGPDKLSIQQSRADGMYATLNGSDQSNEAVTFQSSMDALPELSSMDLDRVDASLIRVRGLLSNEQVEPFSFIMASTGIQEQFFFISSDSPTTKEKLYLQLDFDIFQKQPVLDHNRPYPPPFKVTTNRPQFGLRVIDIPGDDAMGWHLAVFGPGDSERGAPVPYRAVTLKNQASGYNLRFEYPEGSGRYFAVYKIVEHEIQPKPKPSVTLLKTEEELAKGKVKEIAFTFERQKFSEGNQKPPLAAETTPLNKFLLHIASTQLKDQGLAAFTLPSVLGFLVGRSEESTAALLSARLPTALVNSGIIGSLRVDTEKSSLVPYSTALGAQLASRGEIVCTRAPESATFELAPGLWIQTEMVKVILENPRTTKCSILVTTTAVLKAEDGTSWTLSVNCSVSLDAYMKKSPHWSLRFTDTRPPPAQLFSLLKLPSLSNNESEIMKNAPPFCKSPMRDVFSSESVTEIELVYKQSVFGLPGSTLSAITIGTKLDEWRETLPETFTGKDIQLSGDSAVKFKVRNPMHDSLARLGVTVDFTGTVEYTKSTGTKNINLPFTLSAVPLICEGDYEYRLSCCLAEKTSEIGCEGLDAPLLLRSIGHGAAWEKVKAAMPMADDTFMSSSVRAVSIRLQKSPPEYTLGQFELDLELDSLPVAGGSSNDRLELSSAKMHLQTLYGVVKCEGMGIVWIRDHPLYGEVRLSQKNIPGFLTIRSHSGTSFSELLSIPHFASIPLLRSTSFEAQIMTLQFQLPKSASTLPAPIDVSSVNFKFRPYERLLIRNLATLQSVQGSFAVGSVSGTNGKPRMQFYISGETEDHKFSVAIQTEEDVQHISATFYPTEDVSVTATIATLIGMTTKTSISSIIDQLPVESAKIEIAISASGLNPTRCEIKLTPNAAVLVENAKVTGLQFSFDVGVTAHGDRQLKNLSLVWTESATNSIGEYRIKSETASSEKMILSFKPLATGTATAFGVLDRFSIAHPTSIDEPEGIKKEEYLDLAISDLKGTLFLALKDVGFKFSTLQIKVGTPQQKSLVLVESRKINVESMIFEVFYHRGKAAASAGFEGIVRLLTDVDIPVKFKRIDEGELYAGNLVTRSRSDFKKVAVKLLPDTESVLIPPGSGAPENLPVVSGRASFVRSQSASISTKITVTQWNVKFANLDIKFSGLEGLVAATEGAQATWSTALMGKTTFGPFVSAQGALQLCQSKKPILAARLSKPAKACLTKDTSDVGTLVGDISKDSSYWRQIRPEDRPEMTLDPNTGMYLSFETSSILFAGSISSLGGVALLGRKTKGPDANAVSKYDFLVALGITDPSALWKKLGPEISANFNFQSVTVFFSSAVWEESDLKQIAEDAITASEVLKKLPDEDGKFDPKATAAAELTVVSGLLKIPPGQTKVTRGAEFRAVISLDGDKSMTNALKTATEPAMVPTIVLSAKMSDAQTSFGVSVAEFTFKGGAITLKKGEGTFYPNKGKVNGVEGVHTLCFASELQFKIPNTETLLGLVVDTELTTQKVDFEVALKNIKEKPVTINNPFGKSFGLTFQVVKFNGTIILKEIGVSAPSTTVKSSFSLEGRVKIKEYNLFAAVHFYGGKPKVLSATFTSPLSVQEVVEGVVNHGLDDPKLQNWPEESYPPISFAKGCIYYAFLEENEKSLVDPKDATLKYNPGFNIETTMSLFSRTAIICVHVFQDRSGFKIAGALEKPIDLGFLKLYRRSEAKTGNGDGPDVLFVWNKRDDDPHDVGKTRFELNSKASLFDLPQFNCTLAWAAGDKNWNGDHRYNEAAAKIGSQSSNVRIVYMDGRFYINGLDIEKAWDDFKLDKAISDASEKMDPKKCGKLTDLIFDQILKFKYSFNLSFDLAEGGETGGIKATLGIKVRIKLADTAICLDEIELPEYTGLMIFEVPSLEALFKWLHEIGEDYLENVANWLLDHPDQLKKLIGWMSVKKFGKELITTLLCRNIDPENVKERYEELFPEPPPALPPQPPLPRPIQPPIEPPVELPWYLIMLRNLGKSQGLMYRFRK